MPKQELEIMKTWEVSEINFQEITTEAIEEMAKQYLGLTISGIDDAKGYDEVHKARMVVVKRRTTTTKLGKQMRDKANEWNRKVLTEEKRILGLLAPIEEHLDGEETRIDAEKASINSEAEDKEAARIQARVDRLEALGMGLSGGKYRLPFASHVVDVPLALIPSVADEQFDQFIVKIQAAIDAENARLEENELLRKVEAERLAKVAEEQDAERRRLEEMAKLIADEQAQREAVIKAEQDRVRQEQEAREAVIRAVQAAVEFEKKAIENAKQKAIDDARRAEELEAARKEAAARARIEAEGRAAREAQEREVARMEAVEQERLAKIVAEEEVRRKEELRPDKEKLLGFADYLDAMTCPTIKNKRLQKILTQAMESISEIVQGIRNDVGLI